MHERSRDFLPINSQRHIGMQENRRCSAEIMVRSEKSKMAAKMAFLENGCIH